MLKLVARNLAKDALDNLAEDRLFADTDKGKFVLRAASYEDELVYLVIELHRRGKLTWSKSSSEKYVTEYKSLKIEVGDDSPKKSLVITQDKNRYVISHSPLIDALAHTIWHVLDVPHGHFSFDILRDYYNRQKKVAEEVVSILKGR